MNRIFLIGNITKDPELTQTPNGVAVCKFTLSVNRFTTGGEKETDFFPCVAWRGQGRKRANSWRGLFKGFPLRLIATV